MLIIKSFIPKLFNLFIFLFNLPKPHIKWMTIQNGARAHTHTHQKKHIITEQRLYYHLNIGAYPTYVISTRKLHFEYLNSKHYKRYNVRDWEWECIYFIINNLIKKISLYVECVPILTWWWWWWWWFSIKFSTEI